MMKYYIENLYLEITRNCTLECAHCFKGKKQNINMPLNIIDKVFKDIDKIDFLLLCGGEVLLCDKELERVYFNIKTNNIKVNYISIITNATILNSNILKILKELSLISNLQIYISGDKFHFMELEKKKLVDIRNKNVRILKELLNAKCWDYQYNEEYKIDKVGNALLLTQKDIDEINSWKIKTNYKIKSEYETNLKRIRHASPFIVNNSIFRYIQVDACGNISPIYYSYNEEDNLAYGTLNNENSFIENIKLIKKD